MAKKLAQSAIAAAMSQANITAPMTPHMTGDKVSKVAPATPEEVAALEAFKDKPLSATEYQKEFQRLVEDEGNTAFKWVDMACHAPRTFGEHCYESKFYNCTDGKRHWQEPHEDYAAFRSTLEAAYKMPDAPERSDKSEKANETRATRKNISTMLTVYIGRMTSYAAGLPAKNPEKPSLEAWAKRALQQVNGSPAKKDKKGKIIRAAVAPSIQGAAPSELLEMLRELANLNQPAEVKVHEGGKTTSGKRTTIKAAAAEQQAAIA